MSPDGLRFWPLVKSDGERGLTQNWNTEMRGDFSHQVSNKIKGEVSYFIDVVLPITSQLVLDDEQ